MEVGSPQLQPERGAHYSEPDEAAAWVEFESKKRSVQYHVKKCVEFIHCSENSGNLTLDYGQTAELTYQQQSNSLVYYGNGNMSSKGWRLKVESDMAVSGLLSLKYTLDLLYSSGRRMVDIASSLTIWSLLMSASYVVRSLHYDPYLDKGALVTLCAAGACTVSSTYQLFHVGIRALAINRCQRIATSLHSRVISGAVNQHDVEALHHYWFRALSWFRVEDGAGRQRYGMSYGYSDETSGYVIPEDD
ncbi:hypothetical protein V8C42DRAFT_333634 [Trichoderma barbatum]